MTDEIEDPKLDDWKTDANAERRQDQARLTILNRLADAIHDAAEAKRALDIRTSADHYTFEITPEGRIDIKLQECWDDQRHPAADWINIR